MTNKTDRHVPYGERLARESLKFGLRVGGSLLRHTPGLLKTGLFGLPLALMGGHKGSTESADVDLEGSISYQGRSVAGVDYDEYGEPNYIAQNEVDDYNNGLL